MSAASTSPSDDTRHFTHSDEEIINDLPSYVLGSCPSPPAIIPQTDLNISSYHFLSPALGTAKCIQTVLENGKVLWQFPDGLAHGLYYQQQSLKEYIRASFNPEKYPPGVSYSLIPSPLLDQVQLPHPPVLLSSDTNRLLRGYPRKEMIGVLTHFQNTTCALIEWIQLCRGRCATTHRDTDWKWARTVGWDGYSAYENLILIRDEYQRRANTVAMLEACIEAKHRPAIVKRAREVKDRLMKRLADRNDHPGLYLDSDLIGRSRLSYYGPKPQLHFTLPTTLDDSSTCTSTSSITNCATPSSLATVAATVVAEVAAAAPKNRTSSRLNLAKRGGRVGPIRTVKRSYSAPPDSRRHYRDHTSD